VLGNTRACELHRGLGKLPEQLAGGERERGGEHTTTAEMAAVRLGVVRWGAGRGLNSLGLGSAVTKA
jgi:hypothetical protein